MTSASTVLSDRSLVDLLAYIRAINNPTISKDFIGMVEEVVRVESGYFDLYCYLPIEFPLIEDNTRIVDFGYQKQVDNCLKEILEGFGLKHVSLHGSLQERCANLVKLLAIGT